MPRQEKSLHFHISRFGIAVNYIIILALFGMAAAAYTVSSSWQVYGFFAGLAVIILVLTEIGIRSNCITLRHDVITIETGLLSKKTRKVNYHGISEIDIRQSFLQRFLGYGDLEIVALGAQLHQSISHHFSGKGDVKIGPALPTERGIVLKNFQKVKQIEAAILARQRTRKPQ